MAKHRAEAVEPPEVKEPHLDPETCWSRDKRVCPGVCWGCG